MSEPIMFAIDGARPLWGNKEMDTTYRFGALHNGVLLCSRNGEDFTVAAEVMYEGKTATREEMVAAIWN